MRRVKDTLGSSEAVNQNELNTTINTIIIIINNFVVY